MTSYRTGLSGNRRAAARFVRKVHHSIQKAYEDRKSSGVTQASVANALNVHRSVINRQLRGTENISVGRVAEFAWALGYDIDFAFKEPSAVSCNREPDHIPSVIATEPVHLRAETGVEFSKGGGQVRTSGVVLEPSPHKGGPFKVRIDA